VPPNNVKSLKQAKQLPPFERLVERYGRSLLRFCVARLGGDRGQDAFQETLIAALSHYDQLADPASARSWLFTIANRKIIDSFRDQARQPIPSDADLGADNPAPPSGLDLGLWGEVKDLPPKQREALGLRFLADLTHAEIGEVMGTSEAAARRNVHEALKQLKRRSEL
jgi:DNA-directed RNA polymerase specialized sigma24 family protein